MTLDEYLEQFIEGYLLGDLAAMAPIQPAAGEVYGTVGYPMVMTVLSGIEVLGVLTSKTEFEPRERRYGAARFGEFWREYMYPDQPFKELDSVVYKFIRHPLAHSFNTKPMIHVTKCRDSGHLFRRKKDKVICVDALTFADDFTAAYARLRPKIVGAFKTNMKARFSELQKDFWQERWAKERQLAKVPLRTSKDFRLYGHSDKPMGQTGVAGIFSPKASSTGFDTPK